jgi:hypothetical protein
MRDRSRGNIGCLLVILIVFAPPLAVIHKGIVPFIVTLLATIFGFWVLGSIVAAIYNGS